MSFTLRPYQVEAVAAVQQSWARGTVRPAVLMSTGLGKTVVFASLICETLPSLQDKGQRVLVLAHREELLEQAAEKIRASCPRAVVGIVKGGRDESAWADVIVASVQTMARPARRAKVKRIGMVIVDECHNSASKSYRDVLDHYGCFDSTPTVGFTATMTRMDGGLPSIWEEVCFERGTPWAIEEGYLVPARGLSVQVDSFNLANTRVTAGDLNAGDIADALMESDAFEMIAAAYVEHAKDRPGIVFMPNVATATEMDRWFNDSGIRSELITGAMSSTVRRDVYRRYRDGAVQVLTSVMVLTEGFDAPHTSCVVVARPTLSPGLWTQMVGRGLRLHPGKEDCLVMDVAGAAQRHSLACVNDLSGECTGSCECTCLRCGCEPARMRVVRGRQIPISGRCKCRRGGGCGCPCTAAHKAPGEAKECPCSGVPECGCEPDCEACGGCTGVKEVEAREVSAKDLAFTEISLLDETTQKSRFNWLTTRKGIRFLPVGDRVFLYTFPDPSGDGTYVQGRTSNGRAEKLGDSLPADRSVTALERVADDMAEAMAQEVPARSPYNMKSGSWRRTPASDKQLAVLKSIKRSEPAAGLRKGEVADMISVHKASLALDPRFGKYVAK